MALRSLGGQLQRATRARRCSSPVQGALESTECLGSAPRTGLDVGVQRNLYIHLYLGSQNSPAAAAAAAPFFTASRAICSKVPQSGSGFGRGNGNGNVLLAVAGITALAGFFSFFRSREEEPPERVDWSESIVFHKRDQGECQNCWAHVTVGSIEAKHQIETGEVIELSVQQLTDCERFSLGCKGGFLPPAFWYSMSGIASAASYPQRLDKWHGECQSKGVTPAVKISRFSLTNRSEEGLKRAVAKQPVAVNLDFHPVILEYKGGVLGYEQWPTVNDPEYLHAVLVVGYDTDEKGIPYWKMLNSAGPDFGEDGFFRIRRGVPTKYGVGGIRKRCGFYPHMSWFGDKKAVKVMSWFGDKKAGKKTAADNKEIHAGMSAGSTDKTCGCGKGVRKWQQKQVVLHQHPEE